jgi:3',5'-cyclic AMP phosphodiesterase CpdA
MARRLGLLARGRARPDPALLGPLPGGEEQARLRLAVAGDVGHPSAELDATVAAIDRSLDQMPLDGLVLLGDNVYPDGDPALVPDAVFAPFAPVLDRGVRLLAVLGNHDVQSGRGDQVAARLDMPGRWYAEQLGDIRFIGLDSTQPEDPQQRSWLEDTLASRDSPWTVVALHHPPFSAGWHGSNRAVRRSFEPLFRRFGVDLVLAGHEHDYQRSLPQGPTTYVISGAATHLRPTARRSFTAAAWATHHFVDLRVVGDELLVRAVDHAGLVFDGVALPCRSARCQAEAW